MNFIDNKISQTKNHYRPCSTGITEKSQQLTQITAELSTIKEEMEETGQKCDRWRLVFQFFLVSSKLILFVGPLVKIKKAIEELNRDVVRVDVRIPVLEHTLMQSKVREKEEDNDEKADYLRNEPDFD